MTEVKITVNSFFCQRKLCFFVLSKRSRDLIARQGMYSYLSFYIIAETKQNLFLSSNSRRLRSTVQKMSYSCDLLCAETPPANMLF